MSEVNVSKDTMSLIDSFVDQGVLSLKQESDFNRARRFSYDKLISVVKSFVFVSPGDIDIVYSFIRNNYWGVMRSDKFNNFFGNREELFFWQLLLAGGLISHRKLASDVLKSDEMVRSVFDKMRSKGFVISVKVGSKVYYMLSPVFYREVFP